MQIRNATIFCQCYKTKHKSFKYLLSFSRYKIYCIYRYLSTTLQSMFLKYSERFLVSSLSISNFQQCSLLFLWFYFYCYSVLRGRVRSHQKWDLQYEVPLEMAGLHFNLDIVLNFYHENAPLLDHNRCCQSENKNTHSFWIRSEWARVRIIVCMCVCHALLLVIKICRIGNNKTFWLTAVTAHSYLSRLSPSWLSPVFCSLVMSATATQCFPGV